MSDRRKSSRNNAGDRPAISKGGSEMTRTIFGKAALVAAVALVAATGLGQANDKKLALGPADARPPGAPADAAGLPR